MFIKAIKHVVRTKTTSFQEINILRELIKKYNELGVDDDDLDFLLIDKYIPIATRYDDFNIDSFRPLEKNSIILFSTTTETSLAEINTLMMKLGSDENIEIFIKTKFGEEEHVIIIS